MFLGDAQLNVVSLFEGIIVGMMNEQQDLSQCISESEDIINDIQSGIQSIQNGITVSNVKSALNYFYYAFQAFDSELNACYGVIQGIEHIKGEFENFFQLFTDPLIEVTEMASRIIWNWSGVDRDVTGIIHQIQGADQSDGGYALGEYIGQLCYYVLDGKSWWLSNPADKQISNATEVSS